MTAFTTNTVSLPRARRASMLRRIPQLLALHRQRSQLARLDDRALRDLGLSRSEARAEAARPLWDAPGFWYC